MYTTLLETLQDGILTLTINRPDKLNALNRDVFTDLDKAVTAAEEHPEVRAVVITGAGPKSFVAGADITEFGGLGAGEGMDLARRGQRIFARIENSTRPWVAAVNGFALGGGCELAMACHFRVAAANARFGQPEVNLGLIPGYGGTQRLVQLIGKGRALELLLTGNAIDAETALRYGLVNYVTAPEELLPKTYELLTLIASKAPLAVGRCIRAANAVFEPGVDGYEREIEAFGECFDTEDMQEGTAAFLQKRKPEFKGK